MKRLLALVAAVAMVMGALWFRGVFDGDTSGESGSSGSPEGPVRILCATEIATACATAYRTNDEVSLIDAEDPGTTADQLAAGAGDPGWDLWIVSEPWPEIARVRAEVAGSDVVVSAGTAFASAPLRLVAATGTAAAACEAGIAGCALVDAGRPAGMPPATTTGGALGAVAVAGHVLGFTDFATNDLDDGAVRSALEQIANSADQNPNPANRLLTAPGSFDAVVDIAARVPDARRTTATATDVVPAIRARLVAVGRGSSEPDVPGLDALRDALQQIGWSGGGDVPSGLPNAAVVDAVAKLWSDANR